MDIGSLARDTISGIVSTFAVMLILSLGKQIVTRFKQRRAQPKEVLSEGIRNTQEYKDILRMRQSHRLLGFMWLFSFLVYTAAIIFLFVYTRTFVFLLRFETLGMFLSLLCLAPMELNIGYSPITANEVERKRQANRTRTFKEALGAIPIQYIVQEIIFPLIFWLYLIFCAIGLILLLTTPPSPVHNPLLLVIVGNGFAIIAGLFGTYISAKKIYWSLKNLPYVPRQRQMELQQQLTDHEFDQ